MSVILLFLAVLFFSVWWKLPRETAAVFFSDFSLLPGISGRRTRFIYLPRWAAFGSLFLFAIAFLDPTLPTHSTALIPSKGRAIYLALDRSGSMSQGNKWDTLQRSAREFIEARPGDLIGLTAFAREANLLSPLTLDHNYVLERLAKEQVVQDRNRDGTAIGYAIYKTATVIAATKQFDGPYKITDSAIVLITDGFQNPSGLDASNSLRQIEPQDAAEFAAEKGVRLYIVNVDPRAAAAQYAPFRKVLEKSAEKTGGKFYLASRSNTLPRIFSEIDLLEKSEIQQQAKRWPISSYFIGSGVALLLFAICSSQLLFGRLP